MLSPDYQVRSDQEWLEAGNDALNKWDKFIDRFNDRLTLDNPRLVERYVKGELQFLVHFFITGHPRENYVAHFSCFPGSGRGHKSWGQRDKWKDVSVASADHQLLHGIADKDAVVNQGASEHPTMLVHYVESMENPEQRIPTLARIDCAKHFYDVFPEGLYWFEGIGFRRLGVVVNREVDMLSFIQGIGSPEEKELISQVVERGAKTMKEFSDEGRYLWGDTQRLIEAKECASSLRIELRNDSVSAFFGPGSHLPFEITALFFGPLNPLEDEIQAISHPAIIAANCMIVG